MSYEAWVGRTETREDVVPAELVERLAASLGLDAATAAPDGALPPLWHWALFQTWAKPEALGADGHPRRGGFLPPVDDLPRRMWAGGRVEFRAPIRIGERVRRAGTILRVEEKSGRSGRLVFVTVGYEISTSEGVALAEEHDIVYRGGEAAAVATAEPAPAPPAEAFTRSLTPDPVLLFRYSALTGNGHRIHYDLDYVTRVEAYPGLVVHGPLQATLLADLLRRHRPEARLARLAYRGLRPAFGGNALTLVGIPMAGVVRLETRDHLGAICMSADATLG